MLGFCYFHHLTLKSFFFFLISGDIRCIRLMLYSSFGVKKVGKLKKKHGYPGSLKLELISFSHNCTGNYRYNGSFKKGSFYCQKFTVTKL